MIRTRILSAVLLLVLVMIGTLLRVQLTLADPGFDAHNPAGLLRSDPAVLYYFVERILASGGWPAQLVADTHLESPLPMNVPELFALGPEFLIAWVHAWWNSSAPLHITCLWVSSCCASTLVLGVYALSRELGAARSLALGSAALALALPANQRTLGFLLVGEDYSFPLLLLHAATALRALRTQSWGWALASALTLLGALASWHAASFFWTVECCVLFAWYCRSPHSALSSAMARSALGLVFLGAWLIPMLRHTGLAFSLPMGLCLGMAWGKQRRSVVAITLGTLLLGWAYAQWSAAGSREYSHVFGLLWAKLTHFGQLPIDPQALPFEVRIMWQGPFASIAPTTLAWSLGVGCLALWCSAKPTWLAWRQRTTPASWAVLGALFWIGLLLAVWIERVAILPGALAPVVLAVAGTAWVHPWRSTTMAALGLVQLLVAAQHFSQYRIPWYQPVVRREELRAALQAIEVHVPPGASVATDFVNGPAILAHSQRPILLQPKWETLRSRERIEQFLHEYFHGTPASLAQLVREKWGAEYLLIDRATLTMGCRYSAGLAPHQTLPPQSPAARLGSFGPEPTPSVPGFALLYESPRRIVQSNGQPSILFRLYRIQDPVK